MEQIPFYNFSYPGEPESRVLWGQEFETMMTLVRQRFDAGGPDGLIGDVSDDGLREWTDRAVEEFGLPRVQVAAAASVRAQSWNQRHFSPSVVEWARRIPLAEPDKAMEHYRSSAPAPLLNIVAHRLMDLDRELTRPQPARAMQR